MFTIDEVMFFRSEQKYTRVVMADSEVLIKKSLRLGNRREHLPVSENFLKRSRSM